MREKAKLFLDEFIQKMPKYSEFVRNHIIGWIGYMGDEEVRFTQEFDEKYTFDEYVTLYDDFQRSVGDMLKNIKIVKGLTTYSITYGLQFLNDEKIDLLIDTICGNFVVQDEYGTRNAPEEDAEMFFTIYDKYYS